MNFIDLYSLTLHRAIAEKMLLDGDRILSIARNNLDRWLTSKSSIIAGSQAAYAVTERLPEIARASVECDFLFSRGRPNCGKK